MWKHHASIGIWTDSRPNANGSLRLIVRTGGEVSEWKLAQYDRHGYEIFTVDTGLAVTVDDAKTAVTASYMRHRETPVPLEFRRPYA